MMTTGLTPIPSMRINQDVVMIMQIGVKLMILVMETYQMMATLPSLIPPGRFNQDVVMTVTVDYKLNVLMKIDQVLANQTEMLALMRKLTVATEAASEDVEDILPRPLQRAEELEESSRRLEEDGLLRKKTVIY
ncbi:hypothetical protein LSAT2_013108, partial [Lamellibrachia satsuma]